MDKNTIIGLVLMVAVFIGFSFYSSSQIEEQQAQRAEHAREVSNQEAQRLAEAEAARLYEESLTEEQRHERDSIQLAERSNAELMRHGSALLAARPSEINVEKCDTLENDFMTVVFDNLGGKIVDVTLKQYTRYADGPRTELVKMMTPGSAMFGVDIHRNGATEAINTNDYIFDSNIEERDDCYVVTMSLNTAPDASIEYVYTLYKTGEPSRDYLIDFTLNQHGIDPYLRRSDEIILHWDNRSFQNERSFDNEAMATTIAYYDSSEEEMDNIDAMGSREHHRNLRWLALKQQYFTSAIITNDVIHAGMNFTTAPNATSGYMKAYNTRIIIPHTAGTEQYQFGLYYGPNDFNIMKSVEFQGQETHLEELIPMGGWLVGWINRFVTVPVFNWLSDHGLSFGLIILILTLLVKLVILPLTYKSYMSTAKMRAIRPEMEEINKKYPNQDDAMKKQQAMMELYKKAGVSPMGGCLPLLIQMPILWAMFRFFPASIELRGEGFLWSKDLSSYDSVIDLPFNIPFYGDHVSLFALLMALSIFGYSFYTYKQQGAATAGQPGGGMMKFMMVYFMPLMMLCVMNSFASGLCYYYFLSQLMTMIIMFAIRRTVNDAKVRERLLNHKPKKKSKFQERYEEALRQQQEHLNREQRRGRF